MKSGQARPQLSFNVSQQAKSDRNWCYWWSFWGDGPAPPAGRVRPARSGTPPPPTVRTDASFSAAHREFRYVSMAAPQHPHLEP